MNSDIQVFVSLFTGYSDIRFWILDILDARSA